MLELSRIAAVAGTLALGPGACAETADSDDTSSEDSETGETDGLDVPSEPEFPEPLVWYRFEGDGNDEMDNYDAEQGWRGIPYGAGIDGQAAHFFFESGHFNASAFGQTYADLISASSMTVAIRFLIRDLTPIKWNQTLVTIHGTADEKLAIQVTPTWSIEINGAGYAEAPSMGEWHEMVLRFDEGTAWVYIDGDYTGAIDYQAPQWNVQYFLIGAQPYHRDYFVGMIDDLRFYDFSMTSGEAKRLSELGD